MKKIALFGDTIRDLNLMEYPHLASDQYLTLPKTVQIETPGGVRFLGEIMTQVMSGISEISFLSDSIKETDVTVFNVWKPFLKKNDKKKQQAWHIDRIIGRTAPAANDALKAGTKKAPTINPDLLVIDSLGLGGLASLSSGANALLPSPANKKTKDKRKIPGEIVLKMSSLNGGMPFLDQSDILDRLTIITSSALLRERGAAISEGLSWDKTIEDTVREFKSGLSSFDLALCHRVVVLFSAEGAAVFERDRDDRKIHLKKFLFHPSEYEGSCKTKEHKGKMFGDLSIVTVAVVRHLVEKERYPLFAALSLALTAIRSQQETGLIENLEEKDRIKRFDFAGRFAALKDILCQTDCLKDEKNPAGKVIAPDEETKKKRKTLKQYLGTFASAFRHDQLDDVHLNGQPEYESNLLRDATGCGSDYVASKAYQIVMQGVSNSLNNVPIASFGKFVTADRDEIERINAVRKLIISYRNKPKDKKPLSIAVFGPPGSGKSFSIKQLAAQLNFKDKSIHTFNLSEFRTPEQLHTAFHIVRDATVRGEIPLIFWDEFDSDNLKWLKEFLAPMQDAEFRAGSVIHPLGKAIFVFAGGVYQSFQEFEKKAGRENKEDPNEYKKLKVTDFISRLRGYINIKGPNPVVGGDNNHEYLIRRAVLLRKNLENHCSHLASTGKIAAISAPIVQAFLRVPKYLHGARSLEALVTMSDLINSPLFGESALPPDDQLNLHVEANNFRSILRQNTLEQSLIELIAEACHEGWRDQKELEGYVYGPERSDVEPKTHPLLKDYTSLDEDGKEGNRITARLTQGKLAQVGLRIVRLRQGLKGKKHLRSQQNQLIRIEHDIWMRDHLLSGYEYAGKTNDLLKLHRCANKFEDLTPKDKKLDEAIVKSLHNVLLHNGYAIVPVESRKKKKP